MEDIMQLCDVVRETGFAIHRCHKHGHLEQVYENAMAHRLRKLGLDVKQQYPLKVYDEDGTLIGDYSAAVVGGDVQDGIGPITNCSLSFWKRPSTASATLPCTSTWRSREKVKVSGDSAGPVPERWELWELWEL